MTRSYTHPGAFAPPVRRDKLPPKAELKKRYVAQRNSKESLEVDKSGKSRWRRFGVHIERLNSHAEIPSFLQGANGPKCGRSADVW